MSAPADGEGVALLPMGLEQVNPPTGDFEPLHVHPHQEARAEVMSGTLRFAVDSRERRLGPGESITIPAGTPHHFANDGTEDAVAIQEARPSLLGPEFGDESLPRR